MKPNLYIIELKTFLRKRVEYHIYAENRKTAIEKALDRADKSIISSLYRIKVINFIPPSQIIS